MRELFTTFAQSNITGSGQGHVQMNILNEKRAGWKQKILHGMIEYWLSVLYMAIFFSVFANYRRLILAHYQISYEDYGISVIKALVLAKVILVAESLHLGRRFEGKPLIVPTIYKGFLFTICVAIFDVIEAIIRSFIYGRGAMGALDDVMNQFNYEWLAGGLVVFFAFIPFFAVRELRQILGEGTIFKLFFQRRSTKALSEHRTEKKNGEGVDK